MAIAADDPVAAATALHVIGYVPAEAYTRLRAAEMLEASGWRSEAKGQLVQAQGMLAVMGADGWLARADSLARRSALRPS
jgi:hypothetical protein